MEAHPVSTLELIQGTHPPPRNSLRITFYVLRSGRPHRCARARALVAGREQLVDLAACACRASGVGHQHVDLALAVLAEAMNRLESMLGLS